MVTVAAEASIAPNPKNTVSTRRSEANADTKILFFVFVMLFLLIHFDFDFDFCFRRGFA